ncbi:MAG: hypothetical protein ACJA1B_002274, partial [Polaribacter sp.]
AFSSVFSSDEFLQPIKVAASKKVNNIFFISVGF